MQKEILDFIKKEGCRLKNIRGSIIWDKGKDIKLEEDISINKRISEFLSYHYPFTILSEEGYNAISIKDNNDFYWILDPIDGSMNFSKSIPLACISLALWYKKGPIMGIIYDFFRDELYFGSIMNNNLNITDNALINGNPMHVSNINRKDIGVIGTGFPSGRNYNNKSLKNFVNKIKDWKKVRLLGSAALTLAWVACGRMDAYIEEDIYIWDVAAGLALVKAAGGSIYLKHNKKRPNKVTAVATNARLSISEII